MRFTDVIDAHAPENVMRLPHLFVSRAWPLLAASLLWCAHHEMVHAGQIGLLRRYLGFAPVW